MKVDVEDTIAAIASAPGSALRGLIRISGKDVKAILSLLCAGDQQLAAVTGQATPHAFSVQIDLAEDLQMPAEVLLWPTERSYTRQPSAEIHTIGSPPLLKLVLDKLLEFGCRLAEPGEFTMRAFLAGRLDLTQAEAVLGLIDARSEKQFNQALAQLAGGLRGPITDARDELMGLVAEMEAGLDFVEDDIEFINSEQILSGINTAVDNLRSAERQIDHRQSGEDRIRVVLVGRPNAGKSSLFNCLSGATAIVSDQEGTTRDYLQAQLQIDNLEIELIDTAGIEKSPDKVVREPTIDHQMACQTDTQLLRADIKVLCIPSHVEPLPSEAKLISESGESLIVVGTKADLSNDAMAVDEGRMMTSAESGAGIESLRLAIARAGRLRERGESGVATTAARTSASLRDALTCLEEAKTAGAQGSGDEVIVAEIRLALEHLGMIVGVVYTDDILDLVFSKFCIGK